MICRPNCFHHQHTLEFLFFIARSASLVCADTHERAGLLLLLKPVALAGDRHTMRVVEQPVQQRCRERRILRKRGIRLAERRVARYDQVAFFVQHFITWKNRLPCLPNCRIAELPIGR